MPPVDQPTAVDKLTSFKVEEINLLLEDRQLSDQLATLEARKLVVDSRLRALRGVIEGAQLQVQAIQEQAGGKATPPEKSPIPSGKADLVPPGLPLSVDTTQERTDVPPMPPTSEAPASPFEPS